MVALRGVRGEEGRFLSDDDERVEDERIARTIVIDRERTSSVRRFGTSVSPKITPSSGGVA